MTVKTAPVQKNRTTKGPVTKTVLNQWIRDIRNPKFTLRNMTQHSSINELVAIGDKATVYEYSVIGLLLDRLGASWKLTGKSSRNKQTYYYTCMTDKGEYLLAYHVLPGLFIRKLRDLTFSTNDRVKIAEFVEANAALILGQ